MKYWMMGIALVLLSAASAAQEPRGQRATLAAAQERPYVRAAAARSQRVYRPYSNEEQARVRRAERIVEEVRQEDAPNYYRFRTRRDVNGVLRSD